ncbi:phage tail length tape measure family protein [Pararobbsia alpina]|uniref:Bacteriophage tail tape measure C-terminal domain-containing protein n=1 Tax=Pararobbsia alpina TaxID=621374 RepID=A0A6S7CQR9_9BURK|nr:phage tail length tape measure family protein [Pararobbsia alpina]CAB3795485.1 hypothetical protein LMG28138_03889 [Pararobbsia alpina]
MAANQTSVKVTADASGYTAELDRAAKSAAAFGAAQDAASRRVQAAQAAIAEAADNGSTASAKAINNFVSQLSRQADAAGKTQAQMMQLKAAQLGVADSVSEYISQIESAAEHTEHLSFASSGARRELLVLAHEASQGNWSRFGGSLMVLGERIDAMALLLSPLGLAFAATAGTAALFFKMVHDGYAEIDAFNKAINATGGFIGLSAAQMAEMSNGLQTGSMSLKTVRDAMAQVAATGAFTADNLGLATQAAVAMASDIGIGTDKAAESLAKIQDNVLSWVDSYQRAHHTFSAAQVEEIDNFVKLGDTAGATNAIMRDLANSHAAIEADANAHMGAVLDWWNQLKYSVTTVRNAISNIGVPDSIDKQVGDQFAKVEAAQKALAAIQGGSSFSVDAAKQQLAVEMQKLDVLRQQQTVVNSAQRAREASAKSGDAKVAVDSYLRDDKYATPSEKRGNELDAENTAFTKATKDLSQTSADYQAALKKHYAAVQQINDEYAKKTKPKNNSQAFNGRLTSMVAANQLIEAEEKRSATALKAQRDAGYIDNTTYLQRLHDLQATAIDQEIANAQKRVDIAAAKPESSAYQEALKTLQDLTSQRKAVDQELTLALQKSAQVRAGNVQKYSEQEASVLGKQTDSYSTTYKTRFLSTDQKADYDARLKVVQDYQTQLAALKEKYSGPAADQLEYQQEKAVAAQAYEDQRAALEAHLQQEQQLRESYSEQFQKAALAVVGSAQTNAQTAAAAFQASFNDMNNALESFVTTGKFSFSSFATSVLDDLAKIALKAAESQIFNALFNTDSTGFSTGGSVGHYATGGSITGAGTGTSDSIPAMLSNGEYVIRASQANKYRSLLDSINNGRAAHFATGGVVGSVGTQTVGPSVSGGSPIHLSLSGGGGGLTPQDLVALAPQFQSMIDKRMSQKMGGQGGYADMIRRNRI